MSEKTSEKSQPPAIPRSDSEADLGFVRAPMERWFHPLRLFEIAGRVIVSMVFGSYADQRETQAAFKRSSRHSYTDKDEIWFDYTADLGDGWNSGYTVAKLLAEPKIAVTDPSGQTWSTERGRFLVMGGDQAYPLASRDCYRNKVEGPYRSALPWVEGDQPPHLYALPGNHDWYDGLTSFMRLFCQNRWIGGWKTQQLVSYFAIQLPHNWWLFAVDIQLGADIDKPQLDYFDSVLNQMQPGDRVIFATAIPSWIGDSLSGRHDHENIAFLEKRIESQCGKVYINLAGDLHHYARYSNAESGKHKITAGGGGAFMHGTHILPCEITVAESSGTHNYKLDETAVFPSRKESRALVKGNLLFAFRNWEMALFLGFFYSFTNWVAQSASLSLNMNLFERLSQVGFSGSALCEIAKAYLQVLAYSPAAAFLIASYFAAFILFCDPLPEMNKRQALLKKIVGGSIHGLCHLLLFAGLSSILLNFNLNYFNMPIGNLAFWSEMLVLGSLLGGTLMGVYLYITNVFTLLNGEAGFSSNRIQDYKNFLRFHINSKGELTLYPMGIRKVEKSWQLNSKGAPGDSWFVSKSGKPMASYAHLIEAPLKIHPKQ
ncbi:MAG TPA: hypothetical protein VN030_09505 [Cellvibrio sp.]|nr:hypothetical protein [Cellvibrio sp.]